jgi:hypothetical protein
VNKCVPQVFLCVPPTSTCRCTTLARPCALMYTPCAFGLLHARAPACVPRTPCPPPHPPQRPAPPPAGGTAQRSLCLKCPTAPCGAASGFGRHPRIRLDRYVPCDRGAVAGGVGGHCNTPLPSPSRHHRSPLLPPPSPPPLPSTLTRPLSWSAPVQLLRPDPPPPSRLGWMPLSAQSCA